MFGIKVHKAKQFYTKKLYTSEDIPQGHVVACVNEAAKRYVTSPVKWKWLAIFLAHLRWCYLGGLETK